MILELTPPQMRFVRSPSPRALFYGGRGSGKTTSLCAFMMSRMSADPEGLVLLGAQNPAGLHGVILPALTGMLDAFGIKWTFGSEPPYRSRFVSHVNVLSVENGWQAVCRSMYESGADRNLRGLEVGAVVLDEVREMTIDTYEVILACVRQPGHQRLVRMATTPNGDDWVKRKLVDDPSCEVVRATTMDNPFLPEEFHEDLKSWLDADTYRQEVLGEVVVTTIGLACKFDRRRHVADVGEPDPDLPLIFSIDLNVSPLCGAIMQVDERAGTAVVYEELYVERDATTQMACEQFISRRPPGRFEFPALLFMCDEAGGNRATRGTTTDVDVMNRMLGQYPGAECMNNRKVPRQRDRINLLNAMLDPPGKAAPRIMIDESCQHLIDDLASLRWGPDGKLDKTDPRRSHFTDALSYSLWKLLRPTMSALAGATSWDPEAGPRPEEEE